MRAIAVTTGQRTDLWPELPTLAEGGVKGFDAGVWYGIYVPAKTPKATVDRLNAEFVAILNSPEMKTWLRSQGLQAVADLMGVAVARVDDDRVAQCERTAERHGLAAPHRPTDRAVGQRELDRLLQPAAGDRGAPPRHVRATVEPELGPPDRRVGAVDVDLRRRIQR